jgi:hypothetical protein
MPPFLLRLMPIKSWLILGGVVLLILALWLALVAYGNARFNAGAKHEEAKWLEASAALAAEAKKSADRATRREALRIEEHAAKVAAEKEKLDAAAADGTSPLDALFPAG